MHRYIRTNIEGGKKEIKGKEQERGERECRKE
jgi:hypothetical protein